MQYEAFYEARDKILEFIKKDAFGPIKPDELLQEPPLDTYVCGILWPQCTSIIVVTTPTNEDGIDVAEKTSDSDCGIDIEDEQSDVIHEANQFRPSVMALSFALSTSVTLIDVCFQAARYKNIDKPVEGKDYVLHEYQRIALDTGTMEIHLPCRTCMQPLFDGMLRMQIIRRLQISKDEVLWTISIENTKVASQNEIEQNTSSVFQCQLTVRSNFQPVNNSSITSGDFDRQKQSFLYRKSHSYAVGHGCSAAWDSNASLVNEIKSDFLPKSFVPQMIAVSDSSVNCFKMSMWEDGWRASGLTELLLYVNKYSAWADLLKTQLSSIPEVFQAVAKDIISKVADCITRLCSGIETLRTNDTAWRSFCLMNIAMMRQSAKKRGQSEKEVSWYPFQLCYVLLCIPDMTDSSSKWRDIVDLLWFPTGGGKTEAYLGVAAYTIFYRRLTKGDVGKGITVLMRYTLRMLTAQQFERAAALICECDLLRKEEHLLGGEISIGLWVGSDVTPNHVRHPQDDVETAESILEKLKAGLTEDVKSTPIQLVNCPYCGTPLMPNNAYTIENGQFRAHCPNVTCPFHDDLPIITVDDDVYARRPTLLIGTIDKFARLAWEEKTGAIFAEDGYGLPPDLLIQDELHLISGPLGSISGLYEIAIEQLCIKNGVKPKILASTATLCNANAQIKALYGKDTFQFPPSGFEAGDSFFSRVATPKERPQRTYIGYCETGGSLPDAVVRVFGVVRFALQYLICSGVDEKVIDQFWTNIGYFNSLKDLGSADTLIIDRVCSYAESIRRHKFREEAEKANVPKISYEYEYGELTSRKSTREITDVRNQLDRQHYPSPATLNYILSSNMLSVGIDINRLGLMTVYGQPKATSEYIQATSRIGRSNPGLVIVLLHMLRTRDKSHFEQFQTYHQTLNKMVEPTSATPYACRAMDKALHAVFVTLIRHLCPQLRKNKDAANFRKTNEEVVVIKNCLLNMIAERSGETAQYAEGILEEFIEVWHNTAVLKGNHFQYRLLNRSENDTDSLLIPAERSEDARFPPTMNSMREVDAQSGVYLKRRPIL